MADLGAGAVGGATFAVVVPTVGRPSLAVLLEALDSCEGPPPTAIVIVDDRAGATAPLDLAVPERLSDRVRVLPGPGRGPAAARNLGWRSTAAPWVAFLDDDVVVGSDWCTRLRSDLAGLPPWVAGSQGRLRVPLPSERPATDWERNVAGLEEARWATADLAYRRGALEDVGGFDERFPRAYREDADLGLRLVARGWWIVSGERETVHPVRPADRWVSVRLQAGNADDPLMAALHGPGWRERAGIPKGRRQRHLAVTAFALLAVLALGRGRRGAAATGFALWLAGTAELTWARVRPGPRTAEEIATMALSSTVLPLAATGHWLQGCLAVALGLARRGHPRAPVVAPRPVPPDRPALRRPAAVLFDRDGTLVDDVPYNSDPDLVTLRPGTREALDRLRAAGIPTAVISNQSGIARGLLTAAQVRAVNGRVDELAGPLGLWLWCPHGPDDACGCRKPAPGLIEQAALALGVAPADCLVIGDIGTDVEAARAAGAQAVLVPTDVTLPEEIAAAPVVAPDLFAAIDLVLGWKRGARS